VSAEKIQARRTNIRAEVQEHEVRGLFSRSGSKSHAPFVVWDISEDGMGLMIPEKVRTGDELTMTLARPKKMTIAAVVVWCRKRDDGEGYHCGVHVPQHNSRLIALRNAILGQRDGEVDPAK